MNFGFFATWSWDDVKMGVSMGLARNEYAKVKKRRQEINRTFGFFEAPAFNTGEKVGTE